MSDITRTTGPDGPIQPTGAREERLPSDKEAFQKKMKKIDEADPEQKKKRRQQEEETEDVKSLIKEAHKQTGKPVKVKPFQIGKAMTAKAAADSGSPTAAQEEGAMPSVEGADTDQLFLEEEDLQLTPIQGISEEIKAKELSSDEAKIVSQLAKEKKIEKGGEAAETAAELEEEEAVAALTTEAKKKKEEALLTTQQEISATMAPPPSAPGALSPPIPVSPTPYAQLSPEMLELFDRMIGVMTVISTSGVTETTISLDAPQFASSIFFGAEITIREYSTAPKAFNIELKGSAQAVAQFQANIPTLEAAFKSGNYNFKVHRLDTSLTRIPEGPVKDKDQEDKEREQE